MLARHFKLLIPFATLLLACAQPLEPCAGPDCAIPADDDDGGGGGGGGDAPDECEHLETRDCAAKMGLPGIQGCEPGQDGYVWGACEPSSSASTPLVLSFDNTPVDFGSRASASFDVSGDGSCHGTNWPSAATPWLALDRDGSGSIDDGEELFGSMTRLATGMRADNGFAALRELDSNGDGRLSADDDDFGRLTLWADADANRVSTSGELRSLASAGIVSIELDYVVATRCDARGNCERERASFSYRDDNGTLRQGAIIDVHLRHQ
jgi:hypothetical protein